MLRRGEDGAERGFGELRRFILGSRNIPPASNSWARCGEEYWVDGWCCLSGIKTMQGLITLCVVV